MGILLLSVTLLLLDAMPTAAQNRNGPDAVNTIHANTVHPDTPRLEFEWGLFLRSIEGIGISSFDYYGEGIVADMDLLRVQSDVSFALGMRVRYLHLGTGTLIPVIAIFDGSSIDRKSCCLTVRGSLTVGIVGVHGYVGYGTIDQHVVPDIPQAHVEFSSRRGYASGVDVELSFYKHYAGLILTWSVLKGSGRQDYANGGFGFFLSYSP